MQLNCKPIQIHQGDQYPAAFNIQLVQDCLISDRSYEEFVFSDFLCGSDFFHQATAVQSSFGSDGKKEGGKYYIYKCYIKTTAFNEIRL